MGKNKNLTILKSEDFSKNFEKLFNNEDFSDSKIIINNKTIKTHKVIIFLKKGITNKQ
jgi:hypothetical protein